MKTVEIVKTTVKNCFTESDNSTYDLGRIMWAVGGLVFFVISIVAVFVKGQTFSPIDWGAGFGAILGAGGATIAIKSREKT